MHVLHIDSEKTWRGGQQQTAYLLQEMKTQGYQTALVCQPNSAFEKYCNENSLPHFSIKMRNEFDLIAGYQIAKLCKKHKYEILHLHSAHALALGLWIKLFYSKLQLIGVRRVDFHIKQNWFSKFKYENRWLDKIVCVSDGVKKVLLEDGIPGYKLITIHDGIDINRFDDVIPPDDLKRQLRIPENHFVIGTVAAITGHKDYPNLLKAAKIVIEKQKNVSFCAVGDGPDKEKNLALADQLKLGDRFVFTGFQKDVGKYLKIFDIFVLASKLEGLGSSILDAQSVDLPVIACNTGGIPEIITHNKNGLLVPPQSENALAETLMRLLSDQRLREKLIANAKITVDKFAINRIVGKNIQLYQELLSK